MKHLMFFTRSKTLQLLVRMLLSRKHYANNKTNGVTTKNYSKQPVVTNTVNEYDFSNVDNEISKNMYTFTDL